MGWDELLLHAPLSTRRKSTLAVPLPAFEVTTNGPRWRMIHDVLGEK